MTVSAPKIAKPGLLGAIVFAALLAMTGACASLFGLSAARVALHGTSASSVADAN